MAIPFDRDLIDPNPNAPPPRNVLGAMVVFFCCMIIGTIITIAVIHDSQFIPENPSKTAPERDHSPETDARQMEWFDRCFLTSMAISGFIALLVLFRRRSPQEQEESKDEYYSR